MLVLTRKPGQQVRIGDSIVVSVLDCGRNRVAVGIDAPPDVSVMRGEIHSLRSANDAQRRRILIVDDNPTDREICRRFLAADAGQNYEFVEADSAESGLELLHTEAPQCILLDYRLPDLTGVEFLSERRRRRLSADCPVVLLTNYGNEEVVVEALREGASDYLKKGTLTPELLQTRVRDALAARNSFATSV